MCDLTRQYEVTGGALPAPGGPQSLFILAQDAVPAGRRWRKTWGKATASLRTVFKLFKQSSRREPCVLAQRAEGGTS